MAEGFEHGGTGVERTADGEGQSDEDGDVYDEGSDEGDQGVGVVFLV